MTGDLFGDARPVSETVSHGHRTTPAHVVRTLWAQPEFQARSGGLLVDLGAGDGAISGELCRLAGVDDGDGVIRVDVRSMPAWPAGVRYCFDAASPWPDHRQAWGLLVSQVVSNPPWSIQRCPECEATWEASRCMHCLKCSSQLARVDGEDLAQVMVARAMNACPAADVWVIHTTDWRFHTGRGRFFLPTGYPDCTRPPSHALATVIDVAERVAWGDPSARGRVTPHSKMTTLYHFAPVPAARADWHARYRLLPTWDTP